MAGTTVTLDGLIRFVRDQAGSESPLKELAMAAATASELEEVGDALLTYFVDRCRRAGHSWAQIGGSLGVTKQAVQKRFVAGADVVTFERFTARARNVLEHATEAARALRHHYRGTEHLLLGLFGEPEGLAAQILARVGIGRDAAEAAVLERAPRGRTRPQGELPLTPRAIRALKGALEEALDLGHNYVGTEHMLLGLFREPQGVAAQVLDALEAEPDVVRAHAIELLSGFRRGAGASPSASS